VIAAESGYDPGAVSDKGAVGLMQVMPDTGERYGVTGDAKRSVADKLAEPAINVRVGARYLKDLIARFAGDVTLALAAYNAGEGIVDRYGGVPPYPETQAYVRLVGLLHAAWQPALPPVQASPGSRRVTIAKPGAAR
jgi:soluble lytic murein transglycosylase-like protein